MADDETHPCIHGGKGTYSVVTGQDCRSIHHKCVCRDYLKHDCKAKRHDCSCYCSASTGTVCSSVHMHQCICQASWGLGSLAGGDPSLCKCTEHICICKFSNLCRQEGAHPCVCAVRGPQNCKSGKCVCICVSHKCNKSCRAANHTCACRIVMHSADSDRACQFPQPRVDATVCRSTGEHKYYTDIFCPSYDEVS